MLKIGILIKDFDQLENWELRIIEGIKNDPDLELSLLIKDGRKEDNSRITKNIGQILFEKQIQFEKKIYRKNQKGTINRNEIIKFLETIPTLEVKPKRKEFIDIFREEDSKNISEYNLDLILKHGFNILKGQILGVAKYGIWILVHGNNLKKIGPPVFREILTKKPVIPVTLLQLASESGKGFVVDEAFLNPHRHWSFVQTKQSIQEASVSLLFKNIRKVEQKKFLESKLLVEFSLLNQFPRISDSLKYSFNFYSILINKFNEKIFGLFGKRYECWTLFLGKGYFMEEDLSKLEPVKLPKDEFWADPFLFNHNNQQYVFFESLSYKTRKGKISCGLIKGNSIIDVKDVLDLDYHLSYPFIFKEGGEIYMMPETMQNKRLEMYKCMHFPDKWELYATAFEGEIVADATLYKDQNSQRWLFVTKKTSVYSDATSELFIYKVDNLKFDNLQPHKQNPVIIDSRIARNAGPIFEKNGNFFRPSQCSSDAVYGKALNINQITKLTIEDYEELKIKTVEPNFQKGFMSIHHLHQQDNLFVFDAAYKVI